MKAILIIAVLLVIFGAIAFMIINLWPDQVSADNTTVGIGFSENISIGDITVGASDSLMTAIQNMIDTLNQRQETVMTNLTGAVEFGAEIILVLGMLGIALWRQKVVISAVSGVISFFVGITWASTYTGISYGVCFLAAFQLLSALVLALESDGKSEGYSRFRGMFDKIRGWF